MIDVFRTREEHVYRPALATNKPTIVSVVNMDKEARAV
jgi:hypothetical protein